MKHCDYKAALSEALLKAGIKGFVVLGDQMPSVAMHLPTEILRAVIRKEIVYDEDEALVHSGAVPFHQGWTQCCDNELTDRILTENLDEGKE